MRFFDFLPKVFFLLMLNAMTSYAAETKLLSDESSIIHVRVVAAKELPFRHPGTVNNCGINYTANILHSHKGSIIRGILKFSSPFPLMVGREYLLLIGGPKPESHFIVELPRDQEEAYAKCEDGLYSLELGENDALMIWDYPYGLEGKWVMIPIGAIHLNKQLRVKKMHCLYDEGKCLFIRLNDLIDEIK